MPPSPRRSIAFSTHVERLFVPVDAQPALRAGALPAAPSRWVEAPQAAWPQWEAAGCIVLLGEPSLGKTFEFRHQHEQLQRQGVPSFFTEWREWYPGHDLLGLVGDPTPFRTQLAGSEPVHWFVDSLDEGRLQADAAIGELLKALDTLKREGLLSNLRLRLSCRAVDWRQSEQESLHKRLGSTTRSNAEIVVLRLLPLSLPAVHAAARQKLTSDAEVDRFVAALKARHVLALAGHPLLLALMLAEWTDSGHIGSDRTDVYARAVDHLVRESNVKHKDHLAKLVAEADRRQAIAEMAARTVFGGYAGVTWPSEDEPRNMLDLEEMTAPRSHVLAALATALFEPAGGDARTFFHRSFADYMTARLLADGLASGWPLRRILPLFPTMNGIPSPLRELAAWLAGLSPQFQAWLIANDPATACLGDTLRYTPQSRTALVEMLARRYRDRRWQSEFDRFGDLASTLSEAEFRTLLAPVNGLALRTMALDMVESAGRTDLHPALVDVALDDRNEPVLRARAVMVVGTAPASAQAHAAALAKLVELDSDHDPEDEIAGAVLHALYPQFLETSRALRGLRPPRAPNLSGVYRYFWNKLFLDRLPRREPDRTLARAALRQLLAGQVDRPATGAHHDISSAQRLAIVCAPLAGIAAALACEVLAAAGEWSDFVAEDIEVLARWVRQFGHTEQVASLRAALAAPKARQGLLSWWVGRTAEGKHLKLWELPLIDAAPVEEDLDVYLRACERRVADDTQAVDLFQHALQVCWRFPSSNRVDQILAVAARSASLQRAWETNRQCELDGPLAASRRHAAEFEAQHKLVDTRLRESWLARIGDLRAGDADHLVTLVHEVSSELFAPSLASVEERLGAEVREAVATGLALAWESFAHIDGLWPKREGDGSQVPLPNRAIAAAQGFFLQDLGGASDLSALSDAQVECLFWAARHGDSDWRPLFDRLWQTRTEVVWKRIAALLDAEAAGTCPLSNQLWYPLAVAEDLPVELVTHLVDYALRGPLPRLGGTRRQQFAFLRRHADVSRLRSDLLPRLHDEADSLWPSAGAHGSDQLDEEAALAGLAMTWLLDPALIDTFGTRVFSGPTGHHRALGFMHALQSILDPTAGHVSEWNRSIPPEDYAALVPYLFVEEDVTSATPPSGADVPGMLARESRNRLIPHVCSAAPNRAVEWLTTWLAMPRFGHYRDWLASQLAQAQRQVADAAWRGLDRRECDAVLHQSATLVRDVVDLRWLVQELVESRVAPSFKTDYSLTPLLWGKKTELGGRRHADEKALQTAIYALLRAEARSAPVIGAREPEQFDGKKPDLRLSFIVAGDQVDVPIEIKWSDHDELWTAPAEQLLTKYMRDPKVVHGLYIIGWCGRCKAEARGKRSIAMPEALQVALQRKVDAKLIDTGKSVAVHVLDVSVIFA